MRWAGLLVAGLFWYLGGQGAGCDSVACCRNATSDCSRSPVWLTQKLAEYWAYARKTPQVVGFCPWHFSDAPTLKVRLPAWPLVRGLVQPTHPPRPIHKTA